MTMEFRIADTFTDSLTKLTGQEQKVAKTTAFDLQLNPANPGLRFHKLDCAKDPNLWSFVRDRPQLERAIAAVQAAGATPVELDAQIAFSPGHTAISTMHLAKGLEFRAVAVMACDDEVILQQERIESVTDESDLEEV